MHFGDLAGRIVRSFQASIARHLGEDSVSASGQNDQADEESARIQPKRPMVSALIIWG
jgi:hypothetical protein